MNQTVNPWEWYWLKPCKEERKTQSQIVDSIRGELLSFLKQLNDHPLKDGAVLGTQCRFWSTAVGHMAAAVATSALEPMLLSLCIASILAIMAPPPVCPLSQHRGDQ